MLQTDQKENNTANLCSAFNGSALSKNFRHSLGYTYGSLSDDDERQQAHSLYEMRRFEAQHPPFAGYGDDDNAF